MEVLVDSSVWIDYFRNGGSDILDNFIDDNLLITNNLILSELIPFLKMKQHNELIELLYGIDRIELNIDWNQIIEYQEKCLKMESMA